MTSKKPKNIAEEILTIVQSNNDIVSKILQILQKPKSLQEAARELGLTFG